MSKCSEFRHNRHYPDAAYSDEEEAYPLAYIIVTHKEVVQVGVVQRSLGSRLGLGLWLRLYLRVRIRIRNNITNLVLYRNNEPSE